MVSPVRSAASANGTMANQPVNSITIQAARTVRARNMHGEHEFAELRCQDHSYTLNSTARKATCRLPRPLPVRCRMTNTRTRTMKMILNTFTQRGVLGGAPGSGFVCVSDILVAPQLQRFTLRLRCFVD